MIQTVLLSNDLIIDCLKTDYGIEVATLKLLPLGADINASVYQAHAHDQSSYFIKIKRGHHQDISLTILELLHEAGIQQIILPIRTKHAKLNRHIDDFTLIVYPFVEGQDGFTRDLTNEQWITLGKVLNQVHQIKVPTPIQNKIRREAWSPKWREEVRSLYAVIDSKLNGDDISLKLQNYICKHMVEIKQLVDRAEQLAEQLKDQSSEFVLCHSDIHGGNVLMDVSDNIFIVDWDEPIMAPKERDLMFIGAGVANVWNKPHEEIYFYKGYGKTEINMTILAYYRHERIVEDIAVITQEILFKSDKDEDRLIMYQHFIDMFESCGVVNIAFKTDLLIDK